MKKVAFIVLGIFIFTFAKEVLLQLPLSQVKEIKESPVVPVAFFERTVIGRIAEEQLSSLKVNYKILTSLPARKGEEFYIVSPSPYLKRPVAREILGRQGVILMEDGEAFFVKAEEEKIISILHLGFDIAHISLEPVILPEEAEADPGEDTDLSMTVPTGGSEATVPTGGSEATENPVIREIINRITPSEIAQMVRELSGEVPVAVRGRLDTIRTRYAHAAKNSSAIWYMYEKLQGYNLDSINFHTFTWGNNYTDSNVIATKTGRAYPRRYYIIGGHIDATSEIPMTYAPGADDNASGTVAVILAAKYISPYPWKYTMKFIGWNAEELGLHGSARHAQLVHSRGDSLLGVINGDMIATEFTDNDSVRVYTGTRVGSRAIGDTFFTVNQRYNIGLNVRRSTSMPPYSDHYSYYRMGYNAVHVFEDDFCPYYHTTGDRITAYSFDTIYLTKVIRAMVATLATFAVPDTELVHISEEGEELNSQPRISAFPNPFRSQTAIRLPISTEPLSLKIYDVAGKLVKSFNLPAGKERQAASVPSGGSEASVPSGGSEASEIIWDGKGADGKKRPGVYFLRLSIGDKTLSQKLTLVE